MATRTRKPSNPSNPTPKVDRAWSEFQNVIFAFVTTMVTNLVIMARAGCGKTTTIVEVANRLPAKLRVVFCAFNTRIVEELSSRLPPHIECKSIHGLGLGMITAAFGRVRVDKDKGKDIARQVLTAAGQVDKDGQVEYAQLMMVVKLAGLAKNMMLTDMSDIQNAAMSFGITDDDKVALELAGYAWSACDLAAGNKRTVDFDDMIFFPWCFDLRTGRFDVVIVDECQDMNAAQLYIARSLMRADTGRMIVVGDDRQAIYGWRGADADAMGRMTTELEATVLPLSVTYRCPKSIVAVANEIVDDLRAHESAPEGVVNNVTQQIMLTGARPGDFVLSRKNAPMMGLCLGWLAKGVPAVIAGRDVGRMLASMVDKSGADSVPALVEWVEAYRTRESDRLARLDADKSEAKIQEINDKCDCILALTEDASDLREVYSRLDRMFSDDDPRGKIVLSTVHKAKGLERDRVWVLESTFKVGKSTEEDNLWYVAVTRSKSELNIVA